MASTKATINSIQSSFRSVGVGTEDEETFTEMGERWEERKDHPLFNHVILNTLFEFMRGKDLKECRIVCTKWCVATLPSARSKFSIKLHGNSEEMTRKLTDFVKVFRENKLGIPFAEYKLDPFCTTELPGQEFLQICGSTAKMVSLSLIPGRHVLTVEVEDIGEILKAMPNIVSFGISNRIHSRSGNIVKLFPDDSTKPTLTRLRTIIFNDWDPDKTIDICPTFIEEILSVAPNVSQFRALDSRVDPDRSRIGQVLKAIENCRRESVIKELNLFDARTEHFEPIRRLAENGLKLNNLDFVQDYGHERREIDFNNFLPHLATLFKDSIERLSMDEPCHNLIRLPHMPKLERLLLQISRGFDSKCVNLNKLCPALKVVGLHRLGVDNNGWELEEFLPNSEPCPNVNFFSLANVVMKLQVFDNVLKIFPKLTSLELEVKRDGAQILKKIMTQMTQLKLLSMGGMIEGTESIDAFLTGIPVPNVQELEQLVIQLKEMPVQLRDEVIRHYRTQYCQYPSIANLTNLTDLSLDFTGKSDESAWYTQMTDVFVYFGLYSMKHVNTLRIGNCTFTKTSCEILKDEMELETWSFMDVNGCHIIPGVESLRYNSYS